MTDEHVEIEDVTTTLYRISRMEGDLSGSVIPNACHEAMMEISFLRDRVVTLEMQAELMTAVNVQMREELEARGG
jgi:hypothetical protein